MAAQPHPVCTRAEFEERYLHHMDKPNRYCHYGDIDLYAPSEDGAATLLKAVAEPLFRAQQWLRMGNGLSHILLYEFLKIFSALGGRDRELILAAPAELDAVHQQAAITQPYLSQAHPGGGSRSGARISADSSAVVSPRGAATGTGNGACNAILSGSEYKDHDCSNGHSAANGFGSAGNPVGASYGNGSRMHGKSVQDDTSSNGRYSDSHSKGMGSRVVQDDTSSNGRYSDSHSKGLVWEAGSGAHQDGHLDLGDGNAVHKGNGSGNGQLNSNHGDNGDGGLLPKRIHQSQHLLQRFPGAATTPASANTVTVAGPAAAPAGVLPTLDTPPPPPSPLPPPPSPPPPPGFLLLRSHPADRTAALRHPTLRAAIAAGACQPALLVEIYDGCRDFRTDGGVQVRYGRRWSGDAGVAAGGEGVDEGGASSRAAPGAGGGGVRQGPPPLAVTTGKYRLWGRMMEAALLQAAASYDGLVAGPGGARDMGAGAEALRHERGSGNEYGNGNGGGAEQGHCIGSDHAHGGGGDDEVGRDGGGSRSGGAELTAHQQPGPSSASANAAGSRPPIVVWGLLTGLTTWRIYCLREVRHHPGSDDSTPSVAAASSSRHPHPRPRSHLYGLRATAVPKFEILGSGELHVTDRTFTSWPGLVPALAALYGILCTPDGLAIRHQVDFSDPLSYDMPFDLHRDQLMRFHLIMGAPNLPVYGAVGVWVRQRLDEYVQCRREQKRARAVAAASASAAAGVLSTQPATAAWLRLAAPPSTHLVTSPSKAIAVPQSDAGKAAPGVAAVVSAATTASTAAAVMEGAFVSAEAASAGSRPALSTAATWLAAAERTPAAFTTSLAPKVAAAAEATLEAIGSASSPAAQASVTAETIPAAKDTVAAFALAVPYSAPKTASVQDLEQQAQHEAQAQMHGEAWEEPLSTGSLSSGEWEPVPSATPRAAGDPVGLKHAEEDEEGIGGLSEAVSHAAVTTKYYEGRVADAWQHLAQAKERAAKLRERARALGAVLRAGGGGGAGGAATRRSREPAATVATAAIDDVNTNNAGGAGGSL